jgi:hypothetical protein
MCSEAIGPTATEIGRMEPTKRLICLRNTVVTFLQQLLGRNRVIHPDYDAMFSTSESPRTGTVNTHILHFEPKIQIALIQPRFSGMQICPVSVVQKERVTVRLR